MTRLAWVVLGASLAAPAAGVAQGYRLRIESRFQSVSFRGLDADSVRLASVVNGPSGGTYSPDGFAVSCFPGDDYCRFYRPGPKLLGQPLVETADLTLWGLGITGLTVHGSARLATDLGSANVWPGTEPAVTLIEGYAEFARERWQARLGRQFSTGRLGYEGFDGARGVFRLPRLGADIALYGGWGLARGTALPVTSPVLNPLDDFQPRDRQLVAGAEAGVRRGWAELRVEYRREVDPVPSYLVSERAAANVTLTPLRHWQLAGGAEYDFANGWWGSADASLGWSRERLSLAATVRRYRPFFDLWTIWGAFSPVPFRSVGGSAAVSPVKRLWLRATGERYWYDEAATESPLASVEDRGWRATVGATAQLDDRWTLDGGYRAEFGPGASGRSFEGSVSFRPSDRATVQAHASTLSRPLELRFYDAKVATYGMSASVRISDRWQVDGDVARYVERRDRPDAASLDWNQLRLNARVVAWFGSRADRLPPAVRQPAPAR